MPDPLSCLTSQEVPIGRILELRKSYVMIWALRKHFQFIIMRLTTIRIEQLTMMDPMGAFILHAKKRSTLVKARHSKTGIARHTVD